MWQRPPLWKRQLVWGRVGGEGWFNFYFIVSNWFLSFIDNVFVYCLWDWEVRPGVTRKKTHPHLTLFNCNYQERALPSARQRYIFVYIYWRKFLPNVIKVFTKYNRHSPGKTLPRDEYWCEKEGQSCSQLRSWWQWGHLVLGVCWRGASITIYNRLKRGFCWQTFLILTGIHLLGDAHCWGHTSRNGCE